MRIITQIYDLMHTAHVTLKRHQPGISMLDLRQTLASDSNPWSYILDLALILVIGAQTFL